MDRRGFLGSVLGLVASESFFARLWHEPVQQIVPAKFPYRMLFRDSLTGFTVQAPGVARIEQKRDTFDFIAHDLRAQTNICMDQAILLTGSGKVISRGNFYRPAALCSGDTLRVNMTLGAGYSGQSLESIIQELMLRHESDRMHYRHPAVCIG